MTDTTIAGMTATTGVMIAGMITVATIDNQLITLVCETPAFRGRRFVCWRLFLSIRHSLFAIRLPRRSLGEGGPFACPTLPASNR
jgi:hypothetical protein